MTQLDTITQPHTIIQRYTITQRHTITQPDTITQPHTITQPSVTSHFPPHFCKLAGMCSHSAGCDYSNNRVSSTWANSSSM